MQSESEQLRKFKQALRRLDVRHSSNWGRIGEKFAHVEPEKVRIPSLTNTAVYRIPDILSDAELIEIKNVKRQRFTYQIKDFLLYCNQTDRRLVLCIRPDTTLSTELKRRVENGEIELRYLSVIFTQAGREKMKKALEPFISEAIRLC